MGRSCRSLVSIPIVFPLLIPLLLLARCYTWGPHRDQQRTVEGGGGAVGVSLANAGVC